ncbi:golgi reassembly stacking protein 1 [Pyrenophora tritici-repentis Pt-1C-BFP]|uniref:Golgi reassembly stacking protein 1 n=1 Tax=Pyrenophora tritici-repentis (strain Pt-1C-BFP) TaxID=426418 RepID=B2VXQ2_PYRTR|nr:golgi reassembly stacking protein 1 [Pyrenophora tritici-repentis Pt-1C-BFP]EDU45821.1 golgi reassembly stacking protein 1 [Pyrenophora tritici-repentis Pt-1C-BFP]
MTTSQNLQVIINPPSNPTSSKSPLSNSPSTQTPSTPEPLLMSVFGALNRFISRLDAAPLNEEHQSATNGAYGFQVLRNTNLEVPLEPWFDYVIGINGRTIVSYSNWGKGKKEHVILLTWIVEQDNPDPGLFATEVRNCAGTTISVGVFSAKGQKIREVYLQIPADQPTLGVSLQWSPLSISEDVWHILDVAPNSPADAAGLLPYGDYVIGSPEGLVRGESGLSELVDDFLNRPLRLYVYNHEYNVTRPVTITPTRTWGGEGALGCVLGFGALHRIPPRAEQKSLEQDYAPKKASAVPPPPKVGGPPRGPPKSASASRTGTPVQGSNGGEAENVTETEPETEEA